MLEFKPDADKVFERLTAWWNGEVLDRANIAIVAPKKGASLKEIPAPATLEKQWTDIDYVIEKNLARMAATAYMGDALPAMRLDLGPNFLAAALGCKLNFLPDTTWTEPIIPDWQSFAGFPDYRGNQWYKLTVKMTECAAAAAEGRCIAQIPDLHCGGDAVAALRGNEAFLMDFYDDPGRLRQALEFVDDVSCEMVNTFYRISASHGQHGSSGFLVWGPGKTFPLQDDTLALVSPAIAREFLLPGLLKQARNVDHAMMHLDGPEALDKLDMLLESPEIHGIQWQPGAAHRPRIQWIPLMKRILDAGKLLYTGCTAGEVEPLLSALPSRGLRLSLNARDEEEGEQVLKLASKLTH